VKDSPHPGKHRKTLASVRLDEITVLCEDLYPSRGPPDDRQLGIVVFEEGVGAVVSRGNAIPGFAKKGVRDTSLGPVKVLDTSSKGPGAFGQTAVDDSVFELQGAFENCT
jgi:hypothetical protein